MHCPLCNTQLQELSVTTDSGKKFEVYHCGTCGGTWFDSLSLNRIPYHEVVRLADITVMPKTPQVSLHTPRCPRCHRNLLPYHGDAVPRGVRFFRCETCKGIWATQRAIENFKLLQEEAETQHALPSRGIFPALSVAFAPFLFTMFLFVSTFFTIRSLGQLKDSRTKAASQISQPAAISISSSSVAISFTTKEQTTTEIVYGLSSLEMKQLSITSSPSYTHSIVLRELTPNTTYLYRIIIKDANAVSLTTDLFTFQTK